MASVNFALHINHGKLGYDEGVYFQAVQRGWSVNWMDSDDIPTAEFVGKGIAGLQKKISRAELSNFIKNSGSTAYLRHYHPPLPFYPAIALRPVLDALPLEQQLRVVNLVWMLLWVLLYTLICRRFPDIFSWWALLLPASASFAMAVCGFNMHIAFGCFLSLFLLLWRVYESRRNETSQGSSDAALARYGALIFLAATMTCVEYSLFLLGMMFLWLAVQWYNSAAKGQFFREHLVNAGIVAGCVAVLWWGGVFGFGLIKSYAYTTYIGLFRFTPSTFTSVWQMITWKYNASVVELLGGAICLALVAMRFREVLQRGWLFTSFGLIVATLYLQKNPGLQLRWYVFPVFAVIFVVYVPYLLDSGKEQWHNRTSLRRIAFPIAASLLVLWVSAVAVVTPVEAEPEEIYRHIENAKGREIILPISTVSLRHYFPSFTFRQVHDEDFSERLVDSVRAWQNDTVHKRMVVVPKDSKAASNLERKNLTETAHYLIVTN